MIVVIGSIEVRPEALDRALELSLEHVLRSRTESGCLAHDVHQDAENPHRLVFVERWSDLEVLQQHFAVPASGDFVRTISSLASTPPSIKIYQADEISASAD